MLRNARSKNTPNIEKENFQILMMEMEIKPIENFFYD